MVTCLLETAELQAEFCEAEIAVTSKSRFSTSRESDQRMREVRTCLLESTQCQAEGSPVPGKRTLQPTVTQLRASPRVRSVRSALPVSSDRIGRFP